MAAFALTTAAQSSDLTDAETLIVGPDLVPLTVNDYRIRGADGQIVPPVARPGGGAFYEDVGQKMRIEFTAKGLKIPYVDIVLQPASVVYLNVCLNPETGEVKTLVQKSTEPAHSKKIDRRRMGGPGGQQALGGTPANDECAGAIDLPCNSSTTADNTAATTAVDDPLLSCHFAGPNQGVGTLWYSFVASGTSATIDTEGSVFPADDSLLGIYSGACGALVEIGCSEDEGTGLLSTVTVPTTPGDTYYIQLSSFGESDRGAYNLNLSCSGGGGGPANDECADAIEIACNSTIAADNTDATTDPGDPVFSCHFAGPTQGVGTLWYKFVATNDAARLTTNGSLPPADDSLIAIYDGTCGSLTEIGCSEDEGDGLLSDLTVVGLTPGTTYYIQLASFGESDRGEYSLTLECFDAGADANDDCDMAMDLPCNSSITQDNTFATEDATDPAFSCHFSGPNPGFGSLWYTFVATDDSAAIDTNASAGNSDPATDTLLAVYDGTCGAFVELACSEDEGDGLLSELTVGGLIPGNTYYIQVATFSDGSRGEITTTIQCPAPGPPANDECEDAEPIGALPAVLTFDNSLGTTDLADGCDTVNPENNVWFSIMGTGTTITATTCSANTLNSDTVINVFCSECDDLIANCVAGNDDDCPDPAGPIFASTVSWCSQPGVEYLITVGSFSAGAGGVVEMTVTEDGVPCVADVSCAPQGACCLDDGSCVIATADDCAAQGGDYLGDDTDCGNANAVTEGGFEMGGANWAQSSTNFGTPLCTLACGAGGGSGPNSGDWWAWFGGIGAFEAGSVSQSVTIPAGANTLTFALEIPVSSGNGMDFLDVKVDGNTVASYTDADGPFVGYQTQMVDISGFDDGGMHTVEFSSEITGVGGFTNFFVDDVSIAFGESPCVQCFLLDFEGFANGHAVMPGDFADADIAGIGNDNFGAAIYDSSDPGPNSGTGDNDLLVNQGGILILQESGQQTVPGIFDNPDDAQLGGDLFIDFNFPVEVRSLDMIDIDLPPPAQSATVILRDISGNERVYLVPDGYTADGGVMSLDTQTAAPQTGDSADAVLLSSDPGFDGLNVIQVEIELSSSGAVDNVEYCVPN